jgi:hypothetical protein
LAAFVQFRHDTHVPSWIPKHAALAMQQRSHLKKQFPRTWDSLWFWRYRFPTSHRMPPIPLEFAQAACCLGFEAVLAGRASALLLALCILCRVGFCALLRPAEIYNLRVRDVLIRPNFVQS